MKTPQKSTEELRMLVSAPRTTRALSVCDKTLWSMTAPRGDLPAVRIGRRVLYDINDIQAWIQRHKTGGCSDDS